MSESENKIIERWSKSLDSEEQMEKFLSSVLEEENSVSEDGYQEVFLANKLSCCLLSFLGIAQYKGAGKSQGGHYELTEQVINSSLNDLNLTKSVIKKFAWASIMPDFLHFDELIFHAQSLSQENGDLLNPEGKKDQDNFIDFMNEHLSHLDSLISQDDFDFNAFFYHSGVLFHAIEDLACHRGMTNPEHAYLNEIKKSPDLTPGAFDFALLVTKEFVDSFLKERFVKVTEKINNSPKILWSAFPGVKDLIKVLNEGKKFENSALTEIKDSNTASWFFWNHSNDTEDALNEIRENIFGKLGLSK